MKPDTVILNDMDEVEVAPSEMFSRLGMLVVESRVPHPSAKGRTEGPHCPSSPGDGPQHGCRPQASLLCKRAESLQHQMHVLWKNHIPMCIEVLLYEDCGHGEEKANSLDVSMPSSSDNYILLEQWTIQIVPRRHHEGQIRPRELFQAIKSYLHFSQLSAWLNMTQGKIPQNVGYRISPPGEFCISSFKETPQWHTFPVCTVANNAGIKVTMGCLPRRLDNQLLHVPCHQHHLLHAKTSSAVSTGRDASGATSLPVGGASRTSLSPLMVKPHDGSFRDIPQFVSPQRPHASMVPPKQQHKKERSTAQPYVRPMRSSAGPMVYTSGKWPSEHRKKYDKRRSIQEVPQTSQLHQGVGAASMQSTPMRLKPEVTQHKQQTLQDAYRMQRDFKTTTLDQICAQEAAVAANIADQSPPSSSKDESSYLELQKRTGAIPKKLSHNKSLPSLPIETHPMSDLDVFNSELGGASSFKSKPSKSPKVLFTKKSPGQAYFHKDDPKWFFSASTGSDSADSDQSSPEIDKYLKNMKTKADPLSPEEIQNYLANLSIRNRKRQPSPLAKTPSPDFIDPNSQAVKDLTSIFSSFGDGNASNKQSSSLENISDNSTTAKVHPKEVLVEQTPVNVEESNGTICKKSDVPHVKPVRQTTDVQSRSRSPTRISVKQSVNKRRDSELCKTQKDQDVKIPSKDDLKKQGKVSVTETEESEEKVLFRLGDDDNDNVDDDDDQITPRNTEESVKEQFTNGVCKVEGKSSSQVTSNGCHVTNGHHRDDDDLKELSRDSSHGNRVNRSTMKRSVSDSEALRRHLDVPSLPGINKASPLYKTLMARELSNANRQNDELSQGSKAIPTPQERASFRKSLESSAHMIFHARTGLPLQSSPAPMKRRPSDRFDYDENLSNPRSIKNSISCVNLDERNKNDDDNEKDGRFYSTSAPASTNCLLGNFEESLLNGRIEPSGVVEGFTVEIGASGNFCPKHSTLPVTAFFFNLSDDNAPSPYLGHVNMEKVGRRGYHIPKKGTVQVTLFNPNKTVVKMFVVVYDLTDMPANCQTFLRQRTLYMPVSTNRNTKPEDVDQPVYLRYLIHLRFQSSKSSKIYLHTDMRMIFARDKFEFDSRVANYELRSFTEAPTNPKFSPKR